MHTVVNLTMNLIKRSRTVRTAVTRTICAVRYSPSLFYILLMLAMSLKFLLLKFGALMLYTRELMSKNVQKLAFKVVIKRCVLAEGVACGTN